MTRALSPRETEVALLLAEGLTNRQIAERMHLAERTVKNLVSSMFAKLDCTNRTQVALFAAQVLRPDACLHPYLTCDHCGQRVLNGPTASLSAVNGDSRKSA